MDDQKMKRPWTPSWKDPATGETARTGAEHTAWSKLGDYREEMAELLIELDEIAAVGITSEIYKIFHKIPALLRSIGYDPENNY